MSKLKVPNLVHYLTNCPRCWAGGRNNWAFKNSKPASQPAVE